MFNQSNKDHHRQLRRQNGQGGLEGTVYTVHGTPALHVGLSPIFRSRSLSQPVTTANGQGLACAGLTRASISLSRSRSYSGDPLMMMIIR